MIVSEGEVGNGRAEKKTLVLILQSWQQSRACKSTRPSTTLYIRPQAAPPALSKQFHCVPNHNGMDSTSPLTSATCKIFDKLRRKLNKDRRKRFLKDPNVSTSLVTMPSDCRHRLNCCQLTSHCHLRRQISAKTEGATSFHRIVLEDKFKSGLRLLDLYFLVMVHRVLELSNFQSCGVVGSKVMMWSLS